MLFSEQLKQIRCQNPLVLNITNTVAMAFNANALLAIGASPVMSAAPEEIETLVEHASAVVLNIGTLTQAQLALMHQALSRAQQLRKPVVLDPVGAHATAYRCQAALSLLQTTGITVLRGNAAETAALAHKPGQGKGVDSQTATHDVAADAQSLAQTYGCVVAMSGATDFVINPHQITHYTSGDPILTRITGMGCTASALLGAFLAVNPDAMTSAQALYTLLGWIISHLSSSIKGPASLQVQLLDQLFHLDPLVLDQPVPWVVQAA